MGEQRMHHTQKVEIAVHKNLRWYFRLMAQFTVEVLGILGLHGCFSLKMKNKTNFLVKPVEGRLIVASLSFTPKLQSGIPLRNDLSITRPATFDDNI